MYCYKLENKVQSIKDDFLKQIKTLVTYVRDNELLGENVRDAFEEFNFDQVFTEKNNLNIYKSYDYALIDSVINGDFELVKLLIEKGANVQACNNSALRNSVQFKRHEITLYLIEKGANINNAIKYCEKYYPNGGKEIKYTIDFPFFCFFTLLQCMKKTKKNKKRGNSKCKLLQ